MMHVDGNVLAGPLSEVFSADMTSALGTCTGCGDSSPLATAMVWLKPNTWIVRCHVCESVMLTLMQSRTQTRIDLSGITALTIATEG